MQINGVTYTFTGITSRTLPTVLAQFNKPIALTDVLQQPASAPVHYLRDGEVTLDRAAVAELLITVSQAVDQLAAGAERIAADADGHAADSLMYQRIGGIAPP